MGLPSNGFLFFFKSNINELEHVHVRAIHKNEVCCTVLGGKCPQGPNKRVSL